MNKKNCIAERFRYPEIKKREYIGVADPRARVAEHITMISMSGDYYRQAKPVICYDS